MANIYKFSSDKINIFEILIDRSGSMQSDEANVRTGLMQYKQSFEDFPEANSIAVAISKFSDGCQLGDFKHVTDIDTNYYTGGSTALFYSIVKATEHLVNYIDELTKRTGCTPKATFVLFSDGEPCEDPMTWSDGRKAIEKLNYMGIDTVFVAFGEAISSKFGERLGFKCTEEVVNRETVTHFLGDVLSKSCKEQSQRHASLGADFFSKANNSKGYSSRAAQVLDNDSWVNDI